MTIMKNWELHGTDGYWEVVAKPTKLGSQQVEVTIKHTRVPSGPAARPGCATTERGLFPVSGELVAIIAEPQELAELSALMLQMADKIVDEL